MSNVSELDVKHQNEKASELTSGAFLLFIYNFVLPLDPFMGSIKKVKTQTYATILHTFFVSLQNGLAFIRNGREQDCNLSDGRRTNTD